MLAIARDAELHARTAMITVAPATAPGVADYGLRPGDSADLVVFEERSEAEALRSQRPRHLVLRAGRALAGAQPARSVITWRGPREPQPVVEGCGRSRVTVTVRGGRYRWRARRRGRETGIDPVVINVQCGIGDCW